MGILNIGGPSKRVQTDQALEQLNQLNVEEELQTAGITNYLIAAEYTKKSDCLRVSDELGKGNILMLTLHLGPGKKTEEEALLFELKNVVEQKGGEMAKLQTNRLLVVPKHFKIVKKNL